MIQKSILYSPYFGIVANFIGFMILGLLGFLINRYFLLYLGVENLGVMRILTQLIFYVNLAELGLGSASAFALYRPLHENNTQQINIILSTMIGIYKKITVAIMVIGCCLTPLLPFIMHDIEFSSHIYIYWLLFLSSTVISYAYAWKTILITASQEYNYIIIVQNFSKILFNSLQIFIIIKLQSFYLFIFMLVLDNILEYIFYTVYVKKRYKFITSTKERDATIIKNLKNLFWHKFASVAVFNTDLILISMFVSVGLAGIFASYMMIVLFVQSLVGIVARTITPMIGKFIASYTKDEIYAKFYELNYFYLFLACSFSVSLYFTINPFVAIWLGGEYVLSNTSVCLLLINVFITIFRGSCEMFKIASGFFSDIHLPVIEAAINLFCSLILAKFYGLNGIIAGTIVSNILVVLIAKAILVYKICFDKSVVRYMADYLVLAFYLLVIVALSYACLSWMNLQIRDFLEFVWVGLATFGTVSLISFMVLCTNKKFLNFINHSILWRF